MSISNATPEIQAQEELDISACLPDSTIIEGDKSASPATVVEEAPKIPEESPSPLVTPAVPRKLCSVCNQNEPKYKCSRCYLPYCSVACSTLHKATHPAEEPKPAAELQEEPEPQTQNSSSRPGAVDGAANASSREPFAALDDSKELQDLFRQYPRLRTLLNRIEKATQRPMDTNTIQTQNGRKRKEQPWNPERGLQKGIQVLTDLRNTGSKDGKAIREFSTVILRILSQQEGVSARDAVEKEVAAENQKFVEKLLNGES
ncbi:zinc finger (HIT type) family protein [Diplocarpon rosae]|nr:zinc finger (HIT type) family protein [Diplocarpon rosae]